LEDGTVISERALNMDEARVINQRSPLASLSGAVRKNLWPLCVAALLVSNAALLWKVRKIGGELDRVYRAVSAAGLHSLMDSSLPDAQGGTIRLGGVPAHYLVLFIFTRYDAAFYTGEAAGLDQIARERPDVRVFGLMAFVTAGEALDFARQNHVGYPILLDTDGRRLRSLNLPRTPWKTIIDRDRGRLIYQDPPADTAFEGREFVDKLRSLPR
jgi:peroxiredoxin